MKSTTLCWAAFFYFRDDEATAGMVEETRGDFREPAGSAHAQKLADLKAAIAGAGLPLYLYPAHWDAAQERLTGLEAFGDRVHADLLQSLKDAPELATRFADGGGAPPDEFAEEAEQMEAFIEGRTERYVIGSREPLLRDMLAFAAANDAPGIFVLSGDPGSGKSALLARFTRGVAGQPSGIPHSAFVIPHFIGASTGSTDLRRTLHRLCHELAHAAGNTDPLPLDIKDLITHFQKLLAEAAGRRRVILVFDALNQFDATDGAHWLNWLPRELPPGVRIVASVIAPADGQPEHQALAILRARPGTRMEKLEPLTEADTLAVIEGCLRRYAKRLSPEQLAALLAKPAGRLPLYVLTALEEFRTLGTYEEITARIRTLPGDARALFGWILTERLARDPGFRDREGRPCAAALVEKFAACLGVSRHGLSPSELTALLDPGDPLGNIAALLRLLRPYLMRRGELLDFYHGQFREAAEGTCLKTDPRRTAAHQHLADYFVACAKGTDSQKEWETENVRGFSECIVHLIKAGQYVAGAELLNNFPFLLHKVRVGLLEAVFDDYNIFCRAVAQRGSGRAAGVGPASLYSGLRSPWQRRSRGCVFRRRAGLPKLGRDSRRRGIQFAQRHGRAARSSFLRSTRQRGGSPQFRAVGLGIGVEIHLEKFAPLYGPGERGAEMLHNRHGSSHLLISAARSSDEQARRIIEDNAPKKYFYVGERPFSPNRVLRWLPSRRSLPKPAVLPRSLGAGHPPLGHPACSRGSVAKQRIARVTAPARRLPHGRSSPGHLPLCSLTF